MFKQREKQIKNAKPARADLGLNKELNMVNTVSTIHSTVTDVGITGVSRKVVGLMRH